MVVKVPKISPFLTQNMIKNATMATASPNQQQNKAIAAKNNQYFSDGLKYVSDQLGNLFKENKGVMAPRHTPAAVAVITPQNSKYKQPQKYNVNLSEKISVAHGKIPSQQAPKITSPQKAKLSQKQIADNAAAKIAYQNAQARIQQMNSGITKSEQRQFTKLLAANPNDKNLQLIAKRMQNQQVNSSNNNTARNQFGNYANTKFPKYFK